MHTQGFFFEVIVDSNVCNVYSLGRMCDIMCDAMCDAMCDTMCDIICTMNNNVILLVLYHA